MKTVKISISTKIFDKNSKFRFSWFFHMILQRIFLKIWISKIENFRFSQKFQKIQNFQIFQIFLTFLIFVFFSRGWNFWHLHYLQFHRKWGFSWIRQRENFKNQNLKFLKFWNFLRKSKIFDFRNPYFQKNPLKNEKFRKFPSLFSKKISKCRFFISYFRIFSFFSQNMPKCRKIFFFKKMM